MALRHAQIGSHGLKNIRITWVGDDHGGDWEELGASSSEFNVVSIEVMDIGLGKDSVVFELGSSNGGAVGSDQDELGLAGSE